ncbi:hypothetical protein AB0I54_47475, partial [Streptomyces sp. NPDC050625]
MPSTAAAASTPTAPASPSALPPHGEGAAGDRAIQRSLEAAWPADLPAAAERELLTAGGGRQGGGAPRHGRAEWAAGVDDPGQRRAPAVAP